MGKGLMLFKNFKFWKEKNLEIQLDFGWKFNSCIYPFSVSLELRERCDHPGWCFNIGLFCLMNLCFNWYDSRHYESIYGPWENSAIS